MQGMEATTIQYACRHTPTPQGAPVWPTAAHADVPPRQSMNLPDPPMTLGNAPVSSFRDRWYVTQVRAGTEKCAATEIGKRSVAYFLPLECVDRRDLDGRRRTVWRPRFEGYLFFNGGDGDRYRVLDTGYPVGTKIINVLSCALQGQLRAELAALHVMLQSGTVLSHRMGVGDPVRIKSNYPIASLRGIEGYVESDGSGRTHFSIRVSLLQAGTSIEISPDYVEPA